MSLALLTALACTSADPVDTAATGDGGGNSPGDAGLTSPVDGGSATDGGQASTDPAFTRLDWRTDYWIGSLVEVSWEQQRTATVHIEYSFDEDEWLESPPFQADAGQHEQLLVGIPFGVEVQWRVVDDDGNQAEGSRITTEEVPPDLPQPALLVSEPDRWLPEGNYLLTSLNINDGGWNRGTFWTVIYDRAGRVVWALETGADRWTLFAQTSVTGDHLLLDYITYWVEWDDGAGSYVFRRYLDQEIENIPTPGLHHAFVELPDKSLVWGSQDHGGWEAVVQQADGEIEQTVLWSCWDDWSTAWDCKSNGLYYDIGRDSFLFSSYSNDALVEIDRATGESLWWAGDVSGGYSFTEGSRQFDFQHGVSWTDTGTLLLSSHIVEEDGTNDTQAIEYSVDHDSQTLTEIWSYSAGVYARTNGDTWRLDNGNTLHTVGSAGQFIEVDADGETVWHLDLQSDHMTGRSEWIEDLYALVSPDAQH